MAKYSSKTTDGVCVFCSIASGKTEPLGNAILRENEKYMAWLSPFPCTPWHTVIIPKQHYGSDVLHMPENNLQEFIVVAKQVAKIIENAFEHVWRVWLIMEWTGIDHAHIKLIPMHGTWHMKQGERKQYISENTPYFETYPWYLISTDWPRASDQELQKIKEMIKNNQ
jgi:histidine triad (HIT) family protein